MTRTCKILNNLYRLSLVSIFKEFSSKFELIIQPSIKNLTHKMKPLSCSVLAALNMIHKASNKTKSLPSNKAMSSDKSREKSIIDQNIICLKINS